MTTLALQIQQNKITNIDNILFGLCRLHAWKVRKDVGDARTVVFTLPGQSCTASLVPHLQKSFPCERHVFVYDGCIDSVSRGLRSRGNVHVTTPIAQVDLAFYKYDELLAVLPSDKADIVEAWMSSVDGFLKLKHSEKKSGYVPFVCRLGFLMSQVGKLGNGKMDQSELALTNVLQYMTGSRSRVLKEEVLDAAKKVLVDICDAELKAAKKTKGNLTEVERGFIEECAFAHKGILIENKTLMDTVQPKVEWSLKAAKKMTSCACCPLPGEGSDDEEDEDEDQGGDEEGKDTKEKDDAKAMFTAAPSSAYVDGKAMFAFDPSKFTDM